MPAPLPLNEADEEPLEVLPVLNGWVRGSLVGVIVGLAFVFAVALWLDPYEDGVPRRMETHTKLGLPPCTFKTLTSLPCPSCGMTTSFALLVRGDVWNSLQANAVGTLLAAFCLALIPWCAATLVRNRPLFILSFEQALTRIVVLFLTLMLLRWLIVLALTWWQSTQS